MNGPFDMKLGKQQGALICSVLVQRSQTSLGKKGSYGNNVVSHLEKKKSHILIQSIFKRDFQCLLRIARQSLKDLIIYSPNLKKICVPVLIF